MEMMHSPNGQMSVRELTWGMTIMMAMEVVVFDGTSMASASVYTIIISL
jgi:hypothetical protein